MKTTIGVTLPINHRSARMDVRRYRSGSILTTILLACTALAGLGGVFRAAAQPFPNYPCVSQSSTFACFQIKVDSAFAPLFTGGSGTYPGWDSKGLLLTSPGMTDANGGTVIGESAELSTPAVNGPWAQIGLNSTSPCCMVSGYAYTPTAGTSPFYPPGSTPNTPNWFVWPYPNPNNGDAILTELQDLSLTTDFPGGTAGLYPCPPGTSPLIPSWSSIYNNTPFTIQGGFTELNDPLRRCLGMIVANNGTAGNDFPANSFFDVYVQVNLPAISSYSTGFPTAGLMLANQAGDPLIISSTLPASLPTTTGCNTNAQPYVAYTHSAASTAANLYLVTGFPNPVVGQPAFQAGQYFGSIQLAGHGVFDPCDPGPSVYWTNFIRDVIGTVGHLQLTAPVGGTYPGTKYLWPACTYSMAPGTNFAGQPWDALTFTNVTSVSGAYLTMSNFLNPIALPAYGDTVLYTNTNTVITVQWSANNLTNYSTVQSGSNTVIVQIQNTNVANVGNPTTLYNTTLVQLNASGTAFFGPYLLQLSPSNSSAGLHIVHTNQSSGYNISGYFDTYLQLSVNGGSTWYPADSSVRISLGNPPCGAVVAPLYVTQNGTNTVVSWANSSYELQYTTSLTSPSWTNLPGAPPITVPSTPVKKFFRLVCQ